MDGGFCWNLVERSLGTFDLCGFHVRPRCPEGEHRDSAIQQWKFRDKHECQIQKARSVISLWNHCYDDLCFEGLWLLMMIKQRIYVHSNAFKHAKVSSQQKIEVLIHYLPASNIFPKLFQIMINKNMLFLSHGGMGTLLSKENFQLRLVWRVARMGPKTHMVVSHTQGPQLVHNWSLLK